MFGRLLIFLVMLVCSGCSTAAMNTDIASTKWRMENLEKRFQNFREEAESRELVLSSRIATLEKKLDLPVAEQHAMSPASISDAATEKASTDEQIVAKETAVPAMGTDVPTPQKTASDKAYVVDASEKNADEQAAIAMFIPAASKSAATSGRQGKAKPVVETHHESSTPSKAQSPVAKSTPVVARVVKPVLKKKGSVSMYKHGLELLEIGRHVEGRERLEEFLTEFPHDRLAPNAVYWIGESYYSQKEYNVAQDLFRDVLRRYPKSNKAKAAMLKMGYTSKRLLKISEARRYLLKVVEKYPKSNEARLARKMLSGI